MAASSLLLIAALAFLLSPALSLDCTSQEFDNSTKYRNCTELPTLNATLHWNYSPEAKPRPRLSVVFTARPPNPDGWVSWALNPTGTGMEGCRAFIAFKDASGSVALKTYNIGSYSSIVESKLAPYEVQHMRAEASDDTIGIFASLALPEWPPEVNQVWQVGPSVSDGVPAKHEFLPENLKSFNKLVLDSKAAEKGNPPTAPPSQSPTPESSPSPNRSGRKSSISINGFGLYGGMVLLGVLIAGF